MENNLDIWHRNYFTEQYQNPYLFYVLFGTNNIDSLTVSKSKHNIDSMPIELEIKSYSKLNAEHKEYIESFYEDYLGEMLKNQDPELFKQTVNAENITIVTGSFDDTNSLAHLKNTIGITQAVIDTGATAILDIQILKWMKTEEWTSEFFAPKAPQVSKQVVILNSKINDSIWLHTRGMRKFGRPDISIKNVTKQTIDIALKLINRFIEAFAYGLIPNEKKEIWIKGMNKPCFGKVLGDYDNLDFNNYYFELEL